MLGGNLRLASLFLVFTFVAATPYNPVLPAYNTLDEPTLGKETCMCSKRKPCAYQTV